MQNVLLSKLIPPDPSIHYMRRSKLLKKLSQSSQKKLTIVHSGAGYGKTSALAQMMSDQKNVFSWYQVTEEDDDILPFLRHLFYSIQQSVPQFGQSMGDWDRLTMFPKLGELNKLYVMFVNEFCKIKEPFFVVIDDYHLVHHVFQINYILNKIIEHLPSNIHFIVASRTYPSWNCIFQLQMNGQLTECKEEDFLFSKEEIQVFFEDFFGRILSNEEIEKILSVTEGWAIAILLIAIQTNDTNLPIDEITNYSLHNFFSYLSEEVFENLNDEHKQALLNLSIFNTFSIELIENFFAADMAEQIKLLVKQSSFIQPLVGHKEFRLHALFHQFLEMKMCELHHEGFIEQHTKATHYFMNQHNSVNAIYHVFKTGNEKLISQVLVNFAPDFIHAGQFDYLIERLKELPNQMKDAFYSLYFFEGESQRFRAQYERAKKAYEKCLILANQYDDIELIVKANAGLANIYLDTIQPSLAEKFLEKALKLAENLEMERDELYLLQRQYAENLVNLGRAGEAQAWVKLKGIPKHILMQGNLDVRLNLRQGKLYEANQLIKRREDRETLTIDAHRESDVLASLILTLMGENEEAYIRATNCIKNSIRDHAQYSEAVAYLRKGHAARLLNPLDLQEAERYYLKTIELMDEMHVTRAKAESYMGLAIVKGIQGYTKEAVSYVKLGLYETEKVQDRWVSALLLTAQAIVYVKSNRLEEAKQSAVEAKAYYKLGCDQYGEMVTLFWLSYIAYLSESEKEFVTYFQEFLRICEEENYTFFLMKHTLFGPENLFTFVKLMHYADTLSPNEIIVKSVSRYKPIKRGGAIPKYFFELKLLGPFTIYRNGEEVLDKEWKREKAKELFLFFYFHRNRYLLKEEIMQRLWPYASEDARNRDFKVAYNACLKVLEPDRTAREESVYIERKQSMYQLQQCFCFTSDLDYFKKFAELGLDEKDPTMAMEWLLKAVSLYRGAITENYPTIEWLENQREEIRKQYILVVERLSQTYMKLKQFHDVIQWAEKLIQMDATWEEGYRLLMLSYYYLDHRPQAIKWYEKCVSVLEEELNIEPMETTIQIYEMITR